MTDWKPGDVGVSTSDERFIVTSKGECFWVGMDEPSGGPFRTDRPLVVIDPDDTLQVQRLYSAVAKQAGAAAIGVGFVNLRAALREFAQPTPPRPDEPLGLGAVIEDTEGERYIRCQLGNVAPWRAESPPSEDRPWRYFKDLDIPAEGVLSEGVTP